MKGKSRNTRQKELLKKIVAKISSLFSAEELYEKATKQDSSMGIATVYRFLNEEKKKGTLSSYLCDRKTLYSNAKKNHCHFYCEKTNQTFHFSLDDISFLKGKVPGRIKSIQLEVTGVCGDCLE